MVRCTFCGKESDAHRGVHYIKNDGSVNYLCSGKCRKNFLNLKRDKRKVRWSDFFHIARTRAKESHERREAELKIRKVEKAKKAEEAKKVKEIKKAKKVAKKSAKKKK